MEFLTAKGSARGATAAKSKANDKAKKRRDFDDNFDDGELSVVDDVLNDPFEGRQWVNSNFTVTPIYGAALVLGIAALIGVGFASLYVAQFSFQAAPGVQRRSTRSVDDDVNVVVGGESEQYRQRMVQIVQLLSEMDEHILGLYDPALVARWEGERVTESGTARCKKWAVCRVIARERFIRKKGGPNKKKTINRLKETLRIGGKTMRPLRADTGPTVLSSPFDAFEDFLEAAWIGRNSQDAKGCNMFAEDCSGEQT